jgi:hypothetical protein
VETFPGEERVLGAVQEYEAFLKRHPDTPDALAILQTLRETYASLKVPDPAARCEMLMREAPFPRETRRAFYAQSALGWTGWQIVGPFQAAGDRRGMNVTLPPERSVDPDWQPKGPFNVDLRWIKWAPPKDEKGRPPGYGYVELTPLLLSRFDRRQQEDILRGPYFAYAYRRLEVGSRRRAALLFGCRDVVSIWLNGRRVVTESVPGDSRDGQAVAPVLEILSLFEMFVSPLQTVLLVLTTMVCVVSGVSILVSIYNSMSDRRHEIAVMRALGASQGTVMSIVLLDDSVLMLSSMCGNE